jgi:hypothetical protein
MDDRTTAATVLDARFRAWIGRRTCGECTACCVVHAIVATGSAPYRDCCYSTGTSCAIYATRPAECRGYYCGWRLGFGTDQDRPDRGGMVLDVQSDGRTPVLVIWRPLAEQPGQLERAWAMAHDLRDVLLDAGAAPAAIEIHGVPPSRTVRWAAREEHERACDQ